jgi:DNA transposition AAA+ family ATPase
MNTHQKKAIKQKLLEYCEKYDSQNKASNSLKGVSTATISQVLNNNWEQIANEMWLKIAKQIGCSSKELSIVQTANFKFLNSILKDAALNSTVYAVIDNAGSSKTVTTKHYTESNKRAYRIECNEYWNRKMFLSELISVLGRDASGLNVNEMVVDIVRTLKVQENPIIIIDEFDKVNDQVLYFFITLYNQLQDECGIVLCSTDHLEKRIKRGLRLNKKGYKEFYSRIGRKFIELPGVNSSDVTQICLANGITNKQDVKEVIEDCEYDLRRVKRKIHALKNVSEHGSPN